MSNATILHGSTETIIENPEFIDCLHNVNEVAVDGEIFTDVTQVTFTND